MTTAGSLVIDQDYWTVTVDGKPVEELTRIEFRLLVYLAQDPHRVVTKDELLREVWGFRATGATRTLDSHACRLRRKLEAAGGRFIQNVWGVGYRLLDPASLPVAA